jgi:hypothetical protein
MSHVWLLQFPKVLARLYKETKFVDNIEKYLQKSLKLTQARYRKGII